MAEAESKSRVLFESAMGPKIKFKCLDAKGRPTYWARAAKNDPRVAFPHLHPRNECTETPATLTQNEARIQRDQKDQKDRVEVAEAGNRKAQGSYNSEDRISPTRPVPTSTHDVHGQDTPASSGKRKLDRTSPESLPRAKRIHITLKNDQGKRSAPGTADKYKGLKQGPLRDECHARYLPASGSNQELCERLRLDDAARAQNSTSQESVEEKVTSYSSSGAEPLDRYTHMFQKDLRRECLTRGLPVGLAKRDLRHCLRLYDAARALGLTPEESVEAQRATFEHSIEERARSVSPQRSVKVNTSGTASGKVIEGHTLGNTSLESIVDDGQGPTSLESPEDDATPSTDSQTSSEKDISPSSATTQDLAPDGATSDVYPEPVPTSNYAAMGHLALRLLCKSRSIRHRGVSALQLRQDLMEYDRQLAEQALKAGVEVDAEHKPAGLGVTASASPPPAAFIDLDSSSHDGEILEQRPPLVGASAAIVDKEPVSDYDWTVNKPQRPPALTDPQVEARQGDSMDRISAGVLSDNGSYNSPYSPRLVLKSPREIAKESSLPRTPFTKHPVSLQQPLVSLLNLSMKDVDIGANENTHQEAEEKTKPLSEYSVKMAEKEEFNARYVTESPSWVCCCITPGYESRQKQPAEFSANCLYHVSQLAQRGSFTVKEYQEYLVIQQALGRIKSCLCQKSVADHLEHQVTMTQGGFILAQIWREQLIRRQSLTTFRPDMAAYRRKGILEVMHNIQEDFMIELSSRQQKRPLVLWARIEAMAWFLNTLPTSNEWHHFQDWRRPCRYIMLFGIALLTTIDALLQQKLFNDKEPKVPNLGLVLALFIQSTWNSRPCTMNAYHSRDAYTSPFNNDICMQNENGWAAEVVSLADQHGVRINGVKSIDFIVDRWRLRKKGFESMRDRARKDQYAVLHGGDTEPPSNVTLASIAAKEGESPAKKGTGQRVTVRTFRASM